MFVPGDWAPADWPIVDGDLLRLAGCRPLSGFRCHRNGESYTLPETKKNLFNKIYTLLGVQMKNSKYLKNNVFIQVIYREPRFEYFKYDKR